MTGKFGSKILNLVVAKLSNSLAITGVLRLDLEYFRHQLYSPRLIHRLLDKNDREGQV